MTKFTKLKTTHATSLSTNRMNFSRPPRFLRLLRMTIRHHFVRRKKLVICIVRLRVKIIFI